MLSTVAALSTPCVGMRGEKKDDNDEDSTNSEDSVCDRSLSLRLVAVFKSMYTTSQADAGNCFIFCTFQGFPRKQ